MLADEKRAKVLRCSPDPITISTLKEGRFIEVNESFLQMMDYRAKEEVIGRTSAELGVWLSLELQDELRRRLETAGVVRNLELEYRVRSGDVHVGLFSAELIVLEGEPCILLAMKDVSEDRRVRAELQLFRLELERRVAERTAELMESLRQLERSRDDLLSLIDQSQWCSALTDPEGRITFLSPAAQRLFGIGLQQVIGHPWQEVFPFSLHDKAQIKALMERPLTERVRLPLYVETAPAVCYWMEVDVQDDPRDPHRKIFFFHEVLQIDDPRQESGDEAPDFQCLVGRSKPMRVLYAQIRELASLDTTVLIEGETGTGKGLVARTLHDLSRRAHHPFIAVNCDELHESLLGSQLLGHRRGAFTGAIETRHGVFEAANLGTIFLDEIGDMPMNLQTNLLRVLKEKEITRLGESKPRKVDVRVIVATHRDLDQLVAAGSFRQDLLYRIRVARLRLPALRERVEDIPRLAYFFLHHAEATKKKGFKNLSHEAMRALLRYSWPGNVRELKNAIEFAVIRVKGQVLTLKDLPPEIVAAMSASAETPHECHRKRVLEALQVAGWNRNKAARLLGISRATLYRLMARLNIPRGERRQAASSKMA